MDLGIEQKKNHARGRIEAELTPEILRFAQDDNRFLIEMNIKAGAESGRSFLQEDHTTLIFLNGDGGSGYSNC
ncbi:MAG TPA: hypothetical protein VIH74_10355 [Candidatus Acidoferrum sp.]|jgi:hypothetical protein